MLEFWLENDVETVFPNLAGLFPYSQMSIICPQELEVVKPKIPYLYLDGRRFPNVVFDYIGNYINMNAIHSA